MPRRAFAYFAAFGVAVIATPGVAGAQAKIPPSIEFRVPKPPTVAVSDSGAFVAYELHVTNLTPASYTLRRVEIFDAEKRGVPVMTLVDSALARSLARPAPAIPAAQRAHIG